MFKYLLDQMQIEILNIELYRVHQEWNHTNVNSPYTRIYLITDGEGHITSHGERLLLEPGYAFLIPAFSRIDMECRDTFEHYYIHITTTLPDGLNLFSLVDYKYKIPLEDSRISVDVFERLLELNPGLALIERDANKPIYESMLERCEALNRSKSAADLIESNALIRLLISAFLRQDSTNKISSLQGYNRFQTVLKYIHQHLHQEITLQDLAEILDLNPAYFSSLFSQTMGISPINFINQRRIEEAQHLLLSTHKTLKEIASQVGFKDAFYFSRLFKKAVGASPGNYRKQSLAS